METSELSGYIAYIQQLIAATNGGRIEWTRTNPTTFSWTTSAPKRAKTVLQKVTRSEQTRDQAGRIAIQITTQHVLQVTDIASRSQVLSLNTTDSPELAPLLLDLFDAVSLSVGRKAVEYLKSILPPQT
jgi:hypothetical protein